VSAGGYAWWYLDACSEDGREALTVIAFVGSVFSPYYARARARGGADPLDHCAFNVALWSAGRKRWTMTERRLGATERSATALHIGPSAWRREADGFVLDIDEVTVPLPSRLRGRVRVTPDAIVDRAIALDPAGLHHWIAVAPCARVDVEFSAPALRWSGSGYVDSNRGAVPLEQTFAAWQWSRRATRDGTRVDYDIDLADGRHRSLALAFTRAGGVEQASEAACAPLPATRWRLPRAARSDAGSPPQLLCTLEDGPFYARSLIRAARDGTAGLAFHETLSLSRFRAPWVRAMLPFRMPRA
jgi:carotenoid 1,2-hydratase